MEFSYNTCIIVQKAHTMATLFLSVV